MQGRLLNFTVSEKDPEQRVKKDIIFIAPHCRQYKHRYNDIVVQTQLIKRIIGQVATP